MKIVISCSNSKNGENLIYNNKEISFVSSPIEENKNQFNPDDKIPNESRTWRDYVNSQENSNLLESYRLYRPQIYNQLHDEYGSNLYILSAGWGIINSEFKIPKYNITFSNTADNVSRRRATDNYQDFNHLKNIDSNEKILFLGGIDYLWMFYNLTKDLPNEKVIFYKNENIHRNFPFLRDEGLFNLFKYETKTRTNWHYECAIHLMNNNLKWNS
mgnify:CR=1 FL=1